MNQRQGGYMNGPFMWFSPGGSSQQPGAVTDNSPKECSNHSTGCRYLVFCTTGGTFGYLKLHHSSWQPTEESIVRAQGVSVHVHSVHCVEECKHCVCACMCERMPVCAWCVCVHACMRVCDLWAESCKHYTLCPVQSIITSGTQNTWQPGCLSELAVFHNTGYFWQVAVHNMAQAASAYNLIAPEWRHWLQLTFHKLSTVETTQEVPEPLSLMTITLDKYLLNLPYLLFTRKSWQNNNKIHY